MAFTIQDAAAMGNVLGGAINNITNKATTEAKDKLKAEFRKQMNANNGDPTKIDPKLYATEIGMEAMGEFREGLMKDEKFAQFAQDAIKKRTDNDLQYLAAVSDIMWKSAQSGDAASFGEAVKAFNGYVGSPYSIEAVDGGYRILERGMDGTNKPVDDKIHNMQDVISTMDAWTKGNSSSQALLRFRRQISVSNNENMKAPSTWLYAFDRNTGKKTTLVPNREFVDGMGLVHGYVVLDGNGNSTFLSQEEAMRKFGGLLTADQVATEEKNRLDQYKSELSTKATLINAETQRKKNAKLTNTDIKDLTENEVIAFPPTKDEFGEKKKAVADNGLAEAYWLYIQGNRENDTLQARSEFVKQRNRFYKRYREHFNNASEEDIQKIVGKEMADFMAKYNAGEITWNGRPLKRVNENQGKENATNATIGGTGGTQSVAVKNDATAN